MMPKNKIKVSIIVPLYNAVDYIDECLITILNQSFRDIEVIVINDGSTDGSMDIVRKHVVRDERVRLVNRDNYGVSASRNYGMSISSGEYIIFIDADDYLMRHDMIERLYEERTADLVVHEVFYEGKDRGIIYSSSAQIATGETSSYLAKIIISEDFNSPCNKLYSAKIIKENSISFDENLRLGEDLVFNLEYTRYCSSFSHISGHFYFYRTSNAQSATKKYFPGKYDQLMMINDLMLDWATKKQDTKLINAVKYIRIKNVLSCYRDLSSNSHSSSFDWKPLGFKYKNENKHIFIHSIGFRFYLIGIIYSVSGPNLLKKITERL